MSDPCSTGCAQGNIRQAAFNATNYGKFPDASCGVNSDFYTCSSGRTFWGCCKSIPCSDNPTCADGSLVPAFMDRPEQFNFYAASGTVPNTSASSTTTAISSSKGGSKSKGATIGGAVGGAIGGVLIIGLIVFFLFRRRRNEQTARGETVEVQSPMIDAGKAFDPHSPNFAAQSREYSLASFYTRPLLTQAKPHQHIPPLAVTITKAWHQREKSIHTHRVLTHRGNGLTLQMVRKRWKQKLAHPTDTQSSLPRLHDQAHITDTQSFLLDQAVGYRLSTRRSPRRQRTLLSPNRKGWAW